MWSLKIALLAFFAPKMPIIFWFRSSIMAIPLASVGESIRV
jgi:hypothetical protein